MRTASYDPSLNVKNSRSSQSRPRTLPVNTDTVSKAAVETPSNTCFEGSPSAEDLPPTGVVDSLQVVGVSKDGNMHDYETSSTAFDQPGGIYCSSPVCFSNMLHVQDLGIFLFFVLDLFKLSYECANVTSNRFIFSRT